MIRAYDKKYLNDAMLNLGEAFDFAANVCQVELDNFLSMMISTGIAFPFERGVPKYVSGMSGMELALEILQKSGVLVENPAARTEYSCSPADLRQGDGILAYEKVQTVNKLLT